MYYSVYALVLLVLLLRLSEQALLLLLSLLLPCSVLRSLPCAPLLRLDLCLLLLFEQLTTCNN